MASEERPLRILSLDGGGVRGLSSILILKHIMEGVNHERAPSDRLEPYQVFDMIGGTSTGGIIAIMLGRLKMSLNDCQKAYLKLSEQIFTPKRLKYNYIGKGVDFIQASARYDAEILERTVKECISTVTGCDDGLLQDPESACKVFVVATQESNSDVAILRSYKNPLQDNNLYDDCKIWEACRATSAATTFFDPIQIGECGQRFIDGASSYNNPIQRAYSEARNLWPGRETFLLSIGTGNAPGLPFKGNIKAIVESMKKIVTETEQTANDFYNSHRELADKSLYFRFNVVHGLAHIGLQEYRKVGLITEATRTYVSQGETNRSLLACIRKLLADVTTDNINTAMSKGQSEAILGQYHYPKNTVNTTSNPDHKSVRFNSGSQTTITDTSTSSTSLNSKQSAVQEMNNEFTEAAKKGNTLLLLTRIKDLALRSLLLQESVDIALIELSKNEKSESKRLNAIKALLDECAPNLECKDTEHGRTPLIWAACLGHEAISRLLISKKANLEAEDPVFRRTPLLWAARTGARKVAELLLQDIHGPPLIDAIDVHGNTALALAYKNGNLQTSEKLLRCGANPNINIEPEGMPLLVLAVKRVDEKFIRLLIESGANVQTGDHQGRTPLIWAIKRSSVRVVDLLIKKGALRSVADGEGITAQTWAKRSGDPRILALVL